MVQRVAQDTHEVVPGAGVRAICFMLISMRCRALVHRVVVGVRVIPPKDAHVWDVPIALVLGPGTVVVQGLELSAIRAHKPVSVRDRLELWEDGTSSWGRAVHGNTKEVEANGRQSTPRKHNQAYQPRHCTFPRHMCICSTVT